MIKLFDYTFYLICNFFLSRKDRVPAFSAALTLAFIQDAFLLNIYFTLKYFIKFSFPFMMEKWVIIGVLLLIGYLNKIKYDNKNKMEEIINIFEKEKIGIKPVIIIFGIIAIFLYGFILSFIVHNVIEGQSFWR